MKHHIGSSRECASGRVSYRTKSIAKRSAKHQSSKYRSEVNVFQCPRCGMWHLCGTPKEIQRTNFYRRMVGMPERGAVIFAEE